MSEIRGRKVLITGAAMGMGRRMAERFGEEGGELILVDVREDRLSEAAGELRGRAFTVHDFACDLSRKPQIDELVSRVKERVGGIDILVNNAGVVTGGVYDEIPEESDRLMLDVNVASVHWMTKAFLPEMKRRGEGHIVQLASAAGFIGVPEQVVYCASKWFVVGFSEALRAELDGQGHRGIRVTAICPGFVNTGMFDGIKPPMFMPMLDAGFVVDRIIEAVKRNEIFVKEPMIVKTAPILKALLPRRVFDRIADTMGISRAMHTWTGRDGR
jgi:all-trans-retinol dehydrogenase (NAD+)